MSADATNTISTPCIRICTLDGNLCIGCYRTVDEIMAWRGLTETQRQAIMVRLDARRLAYRAATPRLTADHSRESR